LPVLRAGGDAQERPGFGFTILGSIFAGLRIVSFCHGLIASDTLPLVLEPPD
jgi:hypothetical protein